MATANHGSDLFFAILLAIALLACGCDAGSTDQEAPWPTDGWATSSPEDQGLAGFPLAELHQDIESGKYGYVDRMVVVRNGYVVVSARYENDYQQISRGHKGPLGCGVGACEDPSELHQYNYYHPDWHPYYQGRDIHTLQSATISIPTMYDRAMQALYKMALPLVAETTADRNSYGFREGRGCADAIAAAFNALSKPNSAPWILEGDIKGCFDNISQKWMLDNISMDGTVLRKWLRRGTLKTADCTLRVKEPRRVGLSVARCQI